MLHKTQFAWRAWAVRGAVLRVAAWGAVWLMGAAAFAATVEVSQPFVGVRHMLVVEAADGSTKDGPVKLPRPLWIHVLEIDPTAAGVRFVMQPGNGDLPGEVTRSTTPAFVNRVEAQAGVNGDFYGSKEKYPRIDGQYFTNVNHAAVSQGQAYSYPTAARQAIFNVGRDGQPRIVHSVAADSLETKQGVELYNAIGGNVQLVTDGKPTPDGNRDIHPRTLVAITHDGKVLLMVIDGRQKGVSEGMRFSEMATMLVDHFNVRDALNLDGGGSSTMVMDDSDDGKANVRVVNSPSDGSKPHKAGRPRMVANNLAVFAQHVKDANYVALTPPPRPAEPEPVAVTTETAGTKTE